VRERFESVVLTYSDQHDIARSRLRVPAERTQAMPFEIANGEQPRIRREQTASLRSRRSARCWQRPLDVAWVLGRRSPRLSEAGTITVMALRSATFQTAFAASSY
jgi:hypothetical protein